MSGHASKEMRLSCLRFFETEMNWSPMSLMRVVSKTSDFILRSVSRPLRTSYDTISSISLYGYFERSSCSTFWKYGEFEITFTSSKSIKCGRSNAHSKLKLSWNPVVSHRLSRPCFDTPRHPFSEMFFKFANRILSCRDFGLPFMNLNTRSFTRVKFRLSDSTYRMIRLEKRFPNPTNEMLWFPSRFSVNCDIEISDGIFFGSNSKRSSSRRRCFTY